MVGKRIDKRFILDRKRMEQEAGCGATIKDQIQHLFFDDFGDFGPY